MKFRGLLTECCYPLGDPQIKQSENLASPMGSSDDFPCTPSPGGGYFTNPLIADGDQLGAPFRNTPLFDGDGLFEFLSDKHPPPSLPSLINSDNAGPHSAPVDPRDATKTAASENGMSSASSLPTLWKMLISLRNVLACGRLIIRAFALHELPSLVETILSSKDGDETIRRLCANDAQILIDVMAEARSTLMRRHKSVH